MAQSNAALPTALSTQAQSGVRARRNFFSSDNPWLWLSPAILFLLFYSVFPLIFNILVSLYEWRTRAPRYFQWEGLDNWQKLLFDDPRFGNALVVTAQYVVAALGVQLVLGLIIALLLDARPWGVGWMQTALILPMVTAPSIAGMMFRLLEHPDFGIISWIAYRLGLLTPDEPLLGGKGFFALIAILIVEIWQWTPFFILIFLAGLKGLPTEIIEAAEVDGANFWQRIFRIKIPMLFGVITVAVLFRLVDLYKVFDYVVIMTSGGPAGRTETVSFYSYVNTFQQTKWGYGAAIGVFIMLLGWVSAFLYQRVFRVKW